MISITGDLVPPPLELLDQSDELLGYTRLNPEYGQPVNFVALISGLRPVMDDWVPTARHDEYLEVCRARGLYTTLDTRFPGCGHVFVGHDRGIVDRTRWAGWYSPPRRRPPVDHFWVGTGLGYPPCCTRAYAHHDVAGHNHPYQAWRATGVPSVLCNSVLRLSGLSWAAHLPCRYDCAATMSAAAAVRTEMRRHSRELADVIDELAARPFLVIGEHEAFCFIGVAADESTIVYDGVAMAPSLQPNTALFEALRGGTRVQVRDDLVVVFDGDDVIWVEQCHTAGAARVPFVLDFSPDGW